MEKSQINPEKITKPMQLLSAWLVGLILMSSSFLTAATQISKPDWAAGFLVICSFLNIPIFLGSLFLLQTKFRPEMQEDQYYSKHLDRKYGESKSNGIDNGMHRLKEDLNKSTQLLTEALDKNTGGGAMVKAGRREKSGEKVVGLLKRMELIKIASIVGDSPALKRLAKGSEEWTAFSQRHKNSSGFRRDIDRLFIHGIVEGSLEDGINVNLTPLGNELIKYLEEDSHNKGQTSGNSKS